MSRTEILDPQKSLFGHNALCHGDLHLLDDCKVSFGTDQQRRHLDFLLFVRQDEVLCRGFEKESGLVPITGTFIAVFIENVVLRADFGFGDLRCVGEQVVRIEEA